MRGRTDLVGGRKRSLRVVVVSGIFPPDIGGPATHARDVVEVLRDRRHEVSVLTLGDYPRRRVDGRIVQWPRKWPWPLRVAAVASWLVRNRRRYDAVYATGLQVPAVVGARLARRPVVAKIVGDFAWERSTRLGISVKSFDNFQRMRSKGRRERAMRAVRNWSVRHATAVTVPSESLGSVVKNWQRGGGPDVKVIPNGVRLPAGLPVQKREQGQGRLLVVAVGRLVPVKRYEIAIKTAAQVAGLELRIIGEGPESGRLADVATAESVSDRVKLMGGLAHQAVLEEVAQADVLLSTSDHEGLPHVIIEALGVGTPVVASAAGGTGDAVVEGVNGRLVDPPAVAEFAKVMEELRDDPVELARLARGATETGAMWHFDRCAQAVEELLCSLVPQCRPRVINLGKSRVVNPPGRMTERKYAIVARYLDATFIVTGPPGIRCVNGVRVMALPPLRPRLLGGVFFYTAAPALAVATAALHSRTAVVCQSPYEAVGVLALRRVLPRRNRPLVAVEVHGDWRTAPRLYGSRWRQLLAPLSDRLALWSVRNGDRVRVIGQFTEETVRSTGRREGIERYLTFSEFDEFLSRPVVAVGNAKVVLFIGVLQRSKAPDILVEAWAEVSHRMPEARLKIVGSGPMLPELKRLASELGVSDRVDFIDPVPQDALIDLLDGSRCLVLPSPLEGLGRVILEAMARARPVVACAAGGIPELVEDGVTGILVPPASPVPLAAAIAHMLSERDSAAAMGVEGRKRAEARNPAREFEAGIASLAEWAAKASGVPT